MLPIPPDQIDEVLTAASLLITALATLLGVVLGRHVKSSQALQRLSDQVTNSHGTNLRDDIDEIAEQIKEIKQLLTEDRAALVELRKNSHESHKELFNRLIELERKKR